MAALSPTPQFDPAEDQQAAAGTLLPQGMRAPAQFMDTFGAQTGRLVTHVERLGLDTFGLDPNDPNVVENPFAHEARLSSDEANARFGGDGLIRFNAPVSERAAAQQLAQAKEQQQHDEIFADTRPAPLTDFAARMAGGFFDPSNLALMWATGPAGEFAATWLGLRGAAEGIAVGAKLGKAASAATGVGRTFLDGIAVNTPFVAANAALNRSLGEDYDAGDALRDITYGAVFHTGLHVAGLGFSAARAKLEARAGGAEPLDAAAPASAAEQFVPPRSVPDAVSALSPTARMGALMRAFDRFADDEPIEVGRLVQRELEGPDLGRLDEPSAEPRIPGFRELDEATVLTPRGTEVPVRYGLAELGDLVTSHDDYHGQNAAYPQELQRADAGAAGRHAQSHQLEADLDPMRLMQSPSTAEGAPIVAPDGVVESGNARTIALRRSAAKGGAAYGRYLAELKARGFGIEGMQKPILVRMRTEPLTGSQRGALAREMNAQAPEPAAREAPAAGPAPEMTEARQMYANLTERMARGDAGDFDLRAPGKAAESGPAAPPRIDLRPDVEAKPGAEGEAAGPKALTGDQIVAADPELKALAEDTDRFMAEHGVTVEATPKEDPNALAKAIRAAAICVAEAVDEIF